MNRRRIAGAQILPGQVHEVAESEPWGSCYRTFTVFRSHAAAPV